MKDVIKKWNEDGYVAVPIFSRDEIDKIRTRGLELLHERDPNWRDNLPTGSEPYPNPHFKDKMFYSIIRNQKVVDIVKTLILNDNPDLGDIDLQVSQTWMYFKPPGELGRDTHQNSFYVHCDWGKAINISIAIDDSDEENGCMFWYPGSHNDKISWPIDYEKFDLERQKTNPKSWSNERGKPCYIPSMYQNGVLVDKYPRVFTPTKSGDVTFVHSHVLHGSEENKSNDRWRISYLIGYYVKGTYLHTDSKDGMRRNPIDV